MDLLLTYIHCDTDEAFGVQSVSTFLKPHSFLVYSDAAWLDLGKEIHRVVSSTLDNKMNPCQLSREYFT